MGVPPKKRTHRVFLSEEDHFLYMLLLEEMKALRHEVKEFNNRACELTKAIRFVSKQAKVITLPRPKVN